jgi:uncharacterized membrane protein (DUF4010 family)
MTASDLLGLIVATLGGTAVGIERERSGHAEGPSPRFAGVRTFTMLGALAGLAGWLWMNGATLLATCLLAGGVAITVVAYAAASRREVDGTTEVAALVVLTAGLLAGMEHERVASAVFAATTLLLVEKGRLHAFVRRIDEVWLRAGVRFGVLALVVLPLLPQGPYGPLGGVRPRELWALVLFFSGLSFVGHLLRRMVGSRHGYLVSGMVGGLVSSTSVTLTFARLSRAEPASGRALAIGAVGANAVLYPRVLTAVAVLNPALVLPLVSYLAAPALVVMIVAALGARTRRLTDEAGDDEPEGNPLQLVAALQMAGIFQLVLMAVNLAHAVWGQAGLFTTAAILGLTDVDALTVSMAREAAQTVSLETTALAIAVGVLANSVLKTGTALLLGSGTFRTIVSGALTATIVAAALSIWLL